MGPLPKVLAVGAHSRALLSRPRRVRIHSVFRSAANLVGEGWILVLSAARISPYAVLVGIDDLGRALGGPGPAEVLPEGRELSILGRGWEARFSADGARVYDADRQGLSILGRFLEEEASRPSPAAASRLREALAAADLVGPRGPSALSASFLRALASSCSRGPSACWGLLRDLAGRGFGFTPEGDDLIMGFLSAASLARIVPRWEVEEAASRTHEVSGLMILEAAGLNLFSDQEEVLRGLVGFVLGLGGSPVEILARASRLGGSSGHFYAYGVLLALASLIDPLR